MAKLKLAGNVNPKSLFTVEMVAWNLPFFW
jgi:hypothetical protein